MPRIIGPHAGWGIAAGLIAAIVAVPVLAVLLIAFRADRDTLAHMFQTVLPEYSLNTFLLLVGVSIGVTVVGVATAWLVSACRFPGRSVFAWALFLPLALPAYVIGIVYIEVLAYDGPVQTALRLVFGWQSPRDYWFPEVRSLGGAVTMMILVLYPYVFLLARTAFVDRSVSALEASRTLGYGLWATFFRVILPMARPAIAVGVALAGMEVISDFGTVQQFAVNTFTTGIYDVWLGFNDTAGAAVLANALLLFVLMLIGLERISRRHYDPTAGARRYQAAHSVELSRGKALLASLVCFLPLGFGFILPCIVLVQWTWQSFDSIRWQDYAADATNALMMATVTAVIAVMLATLLSYAKRLNKTPAMRAAVGFASLGYAIPGSVIAVGILIPFAWLDHRIDDASEAWFGYSTGLLLSGTVVALLFAYLVRFMALAYGGVNQSLERVSTNVDSAARLLGKGPGATLLQVHIPIIRGGAFTAALLVFVDVMKELPATLILRPFNFSTLATRVFEYASEEQFEDAALWALSIVLVGIVPVVMLSRAIGRSRPTPAEPD